MKSITFFLLMATVALSGGSLVSLGRAFGSEAPSLGSIQLGMTAAEIEAAEPLADWKPVGGAQLGALQSQGTISFGAGHFIFSVFFRNGRSSLISAEDTRSDEDVRACRVRLAHLVGNVELQMGPLAAAKPQGAGPSEVRSLTPRSTVLETNVGENIGGGPMQVVTWLSECTTSKDRNIYTKISAQYLRQEKTKICKVSILERQEGD